MAAASALALEPPELLAPLEEVEPPDEPELLEVLEPLELLELPDEEPPDDLPPEELELMVDPPPPDEPELEIVTPPPDELAPPLVVSPPPVVVLPDLPAPLLPDDTWPCSPFAPEVAASAALFAPETPTDPPQALRKREAKTTGRAATFKCRFKWLEQRRTQLMVIVPMATGARDSTTLEFGIGFFWSRKMGRENGLG
jgi:hypothetical protein